MFSRPSADSWISNFKNVHTASLLPSVLENRKAYRKSLLGIKNVPFFLHSLTEIFSTQILKDFDIHAEMQWSLHRKCVLFLCNFKLKLIWVNKTKYNSPISNYMKIHSTATVSFQAESDSHWCPRRSTLFSFNTEMWALQGRKHRSCQDKHLSFLFLMHTWMHAPTFIFT